MSVCVCVCVCVCEREREREREREIKRTHSVPWKPKQNVGGELRAEKMMPCSLSLSLTGTHAVV